MEIIFLILGILTFLLFLTLGIELAIGNRSIKFLKNFPRLVSINPPRVSVIIPACNEERGLAEALQSVIHQDYENFEIIVVNDRSTDATEEILEQLAKKYSQLQVLQITHLPPRWLGKNHALFSGAQAATGKILLFTDADVVFKPDAISKAVNYLLENRLDHLTCMPDQTTPSLALRIFVATFGLFFSVYSRPWRVKRPNRWHIGIGAFQMIRTSFYRQIGGHLPIAMRPDDDMKLGKLVKLHHGKQEMLWGHEMMGVAWYHSIKELIDGMMKNAFAGLGYSLFLVFAGTLAMLVFDIFPLVAIFLTHGYALWFYLGALIAMIFIFWDGARYLSLSKWFFLGFPFATLLLIYIMWKSALLAVFRGGIDWRGTRYSLKELRANKI